MISGGMKGEVSHTSTVVPPYNCHGTCVIDEMGFSWQDKKWSQTCFCNLRLPTQPNTPNIFSSFWLGAFRLANPAFLSFLLTALLSKTILISTKGSDWAVGPFIFLSDLVICQAWTVWTDIHSLFYNSKFKYGVVQIELLGHPSSVISNIIFTLWTCK